MKETLEGRKTLIGMGLALAVALYQAFFGETPMIDPELLSIVTPIAAILLRFVSTGPVKL